MVLLNQGQPNKDRTKQLEIQQAASGKGHKSIIEAAHFLITSALEIQKI